MNLNSRNLVFCMLFLMKSVIVMSQNNFVGAAHIAINDNAQISYSIGQTFVNRLDNNSQFITEGVQQSFEFYTLSNPEVVKLSITIFPNPTALVLNVNFNDTLKLPIQYRLLDVNGKLIFQGVFTNLDNKINLKGNLAMYYLNLYKKGQFIKSIKVLKK